MGTAKIHIFYEVQNILFNILYFCSVLAFQPLFKNIPFIITAPIAWLYGGITAIRNFLYNKGFIKSYKSPLFTICIGNIQVGGTGKTPLTAWIYKNLSSKYKTAILSRGYGRETNGLIELSESSTPLLVGDEPYWYYKHLNKPVTVVAENRVKGLEYIQKKHQFIEAVLLDDAFQHRRVTCSCNILVSTYNQLYTHDRMLPYGSMREWAIGDRRANIIVISKCPENMELEEKINIISEINPYDYQNVFFTTIKYAEPYFLKQPNIKFNKNNSKIAILTGIAKPQYFIEACNKLGTVVSEFIFPDHRPFTLNELNKISKATKTNCDYIFITEKDAVKLNILALSDEILSKLIVLPMEAKFLFSEEDKFISLLHKQ